MKGYTILIIAITACCTIAQPAWGQKEYTLDECRAAALKQNIRIRKANNETESSKQTEKEMFTKFFPSVSASATAFSANKNLIEMNVAPGMNLSLLKNGVSGSVLATQPVFAGGQIVNGNKLAKVGTEVSKIQMQQSENEVSYTVEQYFWQIISLKEKLKTVVSIKTMLQTLNNDAQSAVNAGVRNRNDLLQVELKQNSIEADRLKLINAIDISKKVLAQYVGEQLDSFDIKEQPIELKELQRPLELMRNHQTSLMLTPEYGLLRKNIEVQNLQKKIEIGKQLPSVGIGAGYIHDYIFDKNNSYGIAFATISVPISDWWGGSHAIKRRKIQLKIAQDELKDNSELLILKMQKNWNELDDAYQQILLSNKSIEQASENLRLHEDYYKAGTVNMSNLLEAQSLYQQSKNQYIDAFAEYQVKKVAYLQSTGETAIK